MADEGVVVGVGSTARHQAGGNSDQGAGRSRDHQGLERLFLDVVGGTLDQAVGRILGPSDALVDGFLDVAGPRSCKVLGVLCAFAHRVCAMADELAGSSANVAQGFPCPVDGRFLDMAGFGNLATGGHAVGSHLASPFGVLATPSGRIECFADVHSILGADGWLPRGSVRRRLVGRTCVVG